MLGLQATMNTVGKSHSEVDLCMYGSTVLRKTFQVENMQQISSYTFWMDFCEQVTKTKPINVTKDHIIRGLEAKESAFSKFNRKP